MTTQEISIPQGWPGSNAAYLAYLALVGAGKVPGRDFTYQPKTQGGRLELGKQVDFVFTNPPDLAINIQGTYFHYEMGIEQKARDRIAAAQMAGQGISLVFIDEEDLLADPSYYINEALNYRDHSRMVRR